MDLEEELDLDDDWGSWEDENRIWELNCAYCGAKMRRRGLVFTCPDCGCKCHTDIQGKQYWDVSKFKFDRHKLATDKQKRAVWICNRYGGRDFFTLNKAAANEFLNKYFEESCAMKEAQEAEVYEEMAEQGLLPDESELF